MALLILFFAFLLNIHTFNQTPVLQFKPICSDLRNLQPNRIPPLDLVSLLRSLEMSVLLHIGKLTVSSSWESCNMKDIIHSCLKFE